MRTLSQSEIASVSGGKAAAPSPDTFRAPPAFDVKGPTVPGRGTGWCRGFGNLKAGETKHGIQLNCGGSE